MVILVVASPFLIPIYAEEPALTTILSNLGFTNINLTDVETFSAGTYNITLYAEFAGWHDINELSYYELSDQYNYIVIFTGPEGDGDGGYVVPPINKSFTADDDFGLSMLSHYGRRYFTQTSRNGDGEIHAIVYENLDDPGMYLIGFENTWNGGDKDYNDMVFSLEPYAPPVEYNLTITTTTGGTTNPAPGTYSYSSGTNVSVTAIPDTCYQFDHWELDGVDIGLINPYTVTMDTNHTLHAVFAITNYTLTITATTGGTTDPSTGAHDYPCCTNVQVTANPDTCYQFDHWELDSSWNYSNPITVHMDSNHTLHAVFTGINYTLTITATSGGTTSPSCGSYEYGCGSNVQVTAYADACYAFDHWELDGMDVGSVNPYNVTMNANHTLHAVFAGINYTLTVNIFGSGSVTKNPNLATYPCGTNVTLTATPDSCWTFSGWSGDASGTNPQITITMDGNKTVTATFTQINYTLTITATTGGTTDPSHGSYEYACSSSVQVTATPDPCYAFDHWELDGSWNYSNPITVHMDDNYTLTAVFVKETFWLNIQVDGTGNTDPAPGAYEYNCCDYVSVSAVETNSCWRFDHWELDSIWNYSHPISVHMDANHTLTAVFVRKTFWLTVQVDGTGDTSPSPGSYEYNCCEYVEVMAIETDPCWEFDHWELDATLNYSNPITVHIDDNYTLTAVFVQKTYWLTIQVDGTGDTDPSPGSYQYNCCDSVEVSAIEIDPCWEFDHWELDATWNYSNPISVHMDANYTLTAVFVKKTFWLTIQVDGTGTTNPSPGAHEYNCCEYVSVSAVETDPCWEFDHWELDGTWNYSTTINVHMDANYTLKAVFVRKTFWLTIQVSGTGTTDPSPGSYEYNCCDYVSVTAIETNPCGKFDHWELDATWNYSNPITVHMDANYTLKAVFTGINYTLTVTTTTGGTTDPSSGSYVYSCCTNVSVTAIPDPCYAFDHWELDGVDVGSDDPYTVTMDADHTLTAVFVEIPVQYDLTITSTPGGTTNPSTGTYSYEEGTVVSVKANPSTGYVFDHWVLDSSDAGSSNPILVTMNKDHTLHAVFRPYEKPVGGYAAPIDIAIGKEISHLLVSQVGLAFTLLAAVALTILLTKRRSKTLKRKH